MAILSIQKQPENIENPFVFQYQTEQSSSDK